jgi:hypothetical protein
VGGRQGAISDPYHRLEYRVRATVGPTRASPRKDLPGSPSSAPTVRATPPWSTTSRCSWRSGGSSYAAISITGRDVRDGSLTGRDIRNNSLTGRDLRGITGHDVRNNSLTGADVANLRRADFVALTPTSHSISKNARVGSTGAGVTEVDCPTGDVVTGGGYEVGVPAAAAHVAGSFPVEPAGWVIEICASPGVGFTAYAVCSG